MSDDREASGPHYRIWIGVLGGLALLALVVVVYLSGSSSKPLPRPPKGGDSEDPHEAALESLAKTTDLDACRRALQQFEAHLVRHPEQRPAPLTPEQRAALQDRKLLALDPDELAEADRSSFTQLDAHHLDRYFLFRDAARSLGAPRDEKQQLAQVAAAFAWVMRQVRLQEWDGRPVDEEFAPRLEITDGKSVVLRSHPPLPPQFVLRRGWGSAMERSFVFLALLEQLGLDGCLVTVEVPGDLGLWACGVRLGNNIYLFDPRLGLPLPGSDDQKIATLAALRARPELLQQYAGDDKRRYDVTPEQAQAARIFLVCPLSAISPRMQFLQQELAQAGNKAVLTHDPAALQKRFQEVAKEPGGKEPPPVAFLLFATRTLFHFLPADEGGIDKYPAFGKRYFEATLVPRHYLPEQIGTLGGRPGQILTRSFDVPFQEFYLRPRAPRDHILRGNHPEATTELTRTLDAIMDLRARMRDNPELVQQVDQWIEKANAAHARMIIAQEAAKGKDVDALARFKAAQNEVEEVWKMGEKPLVALLQRSSAEPMGAEVAYLRALCLHEQAERLQGQAARDAWGETASLWQQYLGEYPAAPGVPAANLLRARALEQLDQRDNAVAVLENLLRILRVPDPAERKGTAFWLRANVLWRIQQVKKPGG